MKPTQPLKKLSALSYDADKQKIAKKRSLDEDEFKSTSTVAVSTSSTKKLKVEMAESVAVPKSDVLANPFLYTEHIDSESEAEENEELDDDNERMYSDDDAESDEEADSLRSQILEEFVLTQKSSGEGSTLLDVIAGASGDGDDTISMDSDEIEAIAKSATGSFGPTKSVGPDQVLDRGDTKAEAVGRPLKNVRIVFSGYAPEHEKDLIQKAQELGAEYLVISLILILFLIAFSVSPQWYQVGPLKCTHFLCASATPQMENMLLMGGNAYSEV
jgi:hypothetical protein